MIGWIGATKDSLPASQSLDHFWSSGKRVSSRVTATEAMPWALRLSAVERARSPSPARPTTAFGSPLSSAMRTSPLPMSVTVGDEEEAPERTARVLRVWSAPRVRSAAQAVRSLFVEAGVRGVSWLVPAICCPEATSTTLTAVVAPATRESPARVEA